MFGGFESPTHLLLVFLVVLLCSAPNGFLRSGVTSAAIHCVKEALTSPDEAPREVDER